MLFDNISKMPTLALMVKLPVKRNTKNIVVAVATIRQLIVLAKLLERFSIQMTSFCTYIVYLKLIDQRFEHILVFFSRVLFMAIRAMPAPLFAILLIFHSTLLR